EGNGYVGLVALLGLALIAIAATRRQLRPRLVLPWLAVGIFALLVTYDGTLGTIIRSLPVFNRSINVRWVSIVAFAVLMLSAFGWDWLARQVTERDDMPSEARWPQRWLGTAGMILLAEGAVIMAIHAAGLLPTPEMQSNGPWLMVNDNYRFYWTIWAVGSALAALGATALWAARWRARWAGFALLCLVLLVDLWSLTYTITPSAPAEDYFPQTTFLTQVKTLVPPAERILVEGDGMPANSALVYAIRDWRAQDPMISE